MKRKTKKEVLGQYDGKRGENGRFLCRWCGVEVPKGRICWCSAKCVDEFKTQYDRSYHKEDVFDRDRGVCARCGADTLKLKKLTKEFIDILGLSIWDCEAKFWTNLGFPYSIDQNWWEMDHIKEHAEGGLNTMDNLQTLCCRCHKKKTAEYAAQRAYREKINKMEEENPFFDPPLSVSPQGDKSTPLIHQIWTENLKKSEN